MSTGLKLSTCQFAFHSTHFWFSVQNGFLLQQKSEPFVGLFSCTWGDRPTNKKPKKAATTTTTTTTTTIQIHGPCYKNGVKEYGYPRVRTGTGGFHFISFMFIPIPLAGEPILLSIFFKGILGGGISEKPWAEKSPTEKFPVPWSFRFNADGVDKFCPDFLNPKSEVHPMFCGKFRYLNPPRVWNFDKKPLKNHQIQTGAEIWHFKRRGL